MLYARRSKDCRAGQTVTRYARPAFSVFVETPLSKPSLFSLTSYPAEVASFSSTNLAHGRFNASLRVTISLADVTPNAGYFSPGKCIVTSWTVFSTVLLLWPLFHFQWTGKTSPTLRNLCVQDEPSKIVKRKAVSNAYRFPI